MSCNSLCDEYRPVGQAVSIPIGFSNELQLENGTTLTTTTIEVSIPIGFSNELQQV